MARPGASTSTMRSSGDAAGARRGTASIADMARSWRDDEASRILCAVAARLHAPRPRACRTCCRCPVGFRNSNPQHAQMGVFSRAAPIARALLADPHRRGRASGGRTGPMMAPPLGRPGSRSAESCQSGFGDATALPTFFRRRQPSQFGSFVRHRSVYWIMTDSGVPEPGDYQIDSPAEQRFSGLGSLEAAMRGHRYVGQ